MQSTTAGAGRRVLAGMLVGLAACAPARERPSQDTVLVYVAASLVRPVQDLLDTLHSRTGTIGLRESGGSLEHARKLTELGRIPDVMILADPEIFDQLLHPEQVAWHLAIARNRMVVAYTDRSRHAADVTAQNWTDVLTRPSVQVGRPDPTTAPAGYRALLLMRLAERHYARPGLAARLLAAAPPRNMRPNAAELAGLLAAGELDYIYEYESLARAQGFRTVPLPPEVDLGDPARAAEYAQASAAFRPDGSADSITVRGAPILFAVSIPRHAPRPDAARRFLALLLSNEGRAVLARAHVDVLERPVLTGALADAPPEVHDAIAP